MLILGGKRAPAGMHGANTELVRSEIRLQNSKIHKICSKIIKGAIFGDKKAPAGMHGANTELVRSEIRKIYKETCRKI